MKPSVRNAADPGQVKAASEKEKFGREQELADVSHLLGSVAGRRFLWRLLGHCGINRTSYDPSGSRVYFNEGMRSVGLWALSEITDANPAAYLSMMQEAANEEIKKQHEENKKEDYE